MAEIAVINKDNTDYDIRDKKLSDHVSASTDTSKVSSASSIMLEASDGSFVSVKRDSFVNAIRDVLGSSIAANTGGTSDVNTIPALTSSGGLKSISTSDIASVLGVNRDFNKYIVSTSYEAYTGIKVSAYEGGQTVLALTSINYSDSDSTCSWVHLLRFGYNNNNVHQVLISSHNGISYYEPQFSSDSNGNLVITSNSPANSHVLLISNKEFRH